MGNNESLVGTLAFLIAAILVFWVLLRLIKIKSFAASFTLGYIALVVFTIIQGWNPLSVGAFHLNPPDLIAVSWPVALVEKYLPSNLDILVLTAGILQYTALGWAVDLIADSVFGK